jgi:hypothetical protein
MLLATPAQRHDGHHLEALGRRQTRRPRRGQGVLVVADAAAAAALAATAESVDGLPMA